MYEKKPSFSQRYEMCRNKIFWKQNGVPVDNNLKIFINRVRREPRPSPTVLWRAVVPIPVLDRKVPIIGLDELSFERRL